MTKPSYEERAAACEDCRNKVYHWCTWKKTDAETRAELARVRGLLQRILVQGLRWGIGGDNAHALRQAQDAAEAYLASGAESADIGKLDTVDKRVGAFCSKCGHEPHGAYCCRNRTCSCDAVPRPGYRTCAKCKTSWLPAEVKQCPTCSQSIDEQFKGMATDEKYQAVTKELAGSAETGGEKAAANPQLVIACLEEAIELFEQDDEVNTPGSDSWLWKVKSEQALIAYAEAEASSTSRRGSQNRTVSSGVEGAHEGTTADKIGEKMTAKEFLQLQRDKWTDLTGYKFAGKPTIDDQACAFAEAYALHLSREPEKLNNAQKECPFCGSIEGKEHHEECDYHKAQDALAESSLGSTPPLDPDDK